MTKANGPSRSKAIINLAAEMGLEIVEMNVLGAMLSDPNEPAPYRHVDTQISEDGLEYTAYTID